MGIWYRFRDLIRPWYTPAMPAAHETTKRIKGLEHEVSQLRREVDRLTRLVEILLRAHAPRVGSIDLVPSVPFPTPPRQESHP
jgi:hypothetical protein